MSNYLRNTLKDFGAEITPDDVRFCVEKSFGNRRMVEARPQKVFAAHIFQEHLGVPQDLVTETWGEKRFQDPDDISKMAQEFNNWLQRSSTLERVTEICDALLGRTENVTSDQKWANAYASAISETFSVSRKIGLNGIETPAQKGKRWGALVAEATAIQICKHAGSLVGLKFRPSATNQANTP